MMDPYLFPSSDFGTLRIHIVVAWVTRPVSGWTRYTQPPIPRRGVRTGTRRQWKRAHPQGWRWRTWQVEVDDHPILRTPDGLFMTARSKHRLDQVLDAKTAGAPT